MNRRNERSSDRAAVVGLLAVGAVFLLIVGYGWSRLFSSFGGFVSIGCGVVAGLIALGIAYFIASAKEEAGRWTLASILSFVILFCISALGSLNSLFTAFQSEDVIKTELNGSYEHIIKLRDRAGAALDTADAATFRLDVLSKWERLKEEIENPTRCGQGPVAAARLQELRAVLPNFQLLSGLDCATATATIPTYDRKIRELLGRAPIVLKAKPVEEKRESIIRKSDEIIKIINDAQARAGEAASLNVVKASVKEANTRFAVIRQEAEVAAPGAFSEIPRQLDTFQIEALGNIGQVLPFMAARLSSPTTYIFFVIALILDLAMVAMFGSVLSRHPARRDLPAASQPEAL